VRTTDDLINALTKSRDDRLAAGELVDVRAVQQEITAHQELARLRERRAAAVKAKDFQVANDLAAQIEHWLRFVTEDVDDRAAEDPKKNTTKLVDPVPPAAGIKA
jgi:hypothetical protein